MAAAATTHAAGKAAPDTARAPAVEPEARERPPALGPVAAGNRAAAHLVGRPRPPDPPDAGPPGAASVAAPTERLEREAHAVADRVAGTTRAEPPPADAPTADARAASLGAGEPLDPATRSRFEDALGADLGSVRLHTDAPAAASAQRVGASAYAVGHHVVFGPDAFSPATGRGTWLLAHELTHVLQHADGAAAVLHRAPEDVPALDKKLYDGVRAGGSAGWSAAAEALNYFAEYDIRLRLSDRPGEGRPVLTVAQIAEIHLAAVRHPTLGPGSNAAVLTRYAQLDVTYGKQIEAGQWQQAAESLNAFNDADMMTRLGRLPIDTLRSLLLGALQNPRVGKDSAIAVNAQKAVLRANAAILERAAKGGAGLTPPTSTSVQGPPGSFGLLSAGGAAGSPGVPPAKQEALDPATDWAKDPAYIDNGIVHASYNMLSGVFQLDYENGTVLLLDFDQALAGAGGGPGLRTYFRNRDDGRVYPSLLGRSTVPTITACAVELHRKEPEGQRRLLNALIDLAVAAHGVGTATLRANQAIAGGGSAAKPKQKQAAEDGAAPPPAKGGSGTKPATGEGSGSGSSGSSTAADGKGGLSAAGPGKGAGAQGKATQGGLQEVTPGTASRGVVPTEGLPDPAFMRTLPPGARFGGGFAAQKAAGEILMEAERLGPGLLVSAEQGAAVVGRTATVASGTLTVGGLKLVGVALVTGGKFVLNAGAVAARPVLYALVTGDVVRLVVPAAATDEPMKAPGADSTPLTAPGTGSGTARAPGKDTGAVEAPGKWTDAEIRDPFADGQKECEQLNLAGKRHQHHLFPQEYEIEFGEIGIEVDGYCISVRPEDHRRAHGRQDWNGEWHDFFADLPSRSLTPDQQATWREKALQLVADQIEKMGWGHLKVRPYFPITKKK